MISILFMALSYKTPAQSLDIIPLTLNMYRNPKAFYSSDIPEYGKIYNEQIESFKGTAINVTNRSVTEGKHNISI